MRSDRPQSRDSRGDNGAPRRPRRPGGKDRFAPRRKVDQFAIDGIHEVDYKDFQRLRRYISDRGKIEPRRKTGLSAFHQRSLTTAIKRARFMALLPYVSSHSR
jgi:small subunit ribosomal protein S18